MSRHFRLTGEPRAPVPEEKVGCCVLSGPHTPACLLCRGQNSQSRCRELLTSGHGQVAWSRVSLTFCDLLTRTEDFRTAVTLILGVPQECGLFSLLLCYINRSIL